MSEGAGQGDAKYPVVQSSDGQPGLQGADAAAFAGGAEHPEIDLAVAFAAGILCARLLARLTRSDD